MIDPAKVALLLTGAEIEKATPIEGGLGLELVVYANGAVQTIRLMAAEVAVESLSLGRYDHRRPALEVGLVTHETKTVERLEFM